MLVDYGIQKGSLEAMHRSAVAYGALGVVSIQNQYVYQNSTFYEKLADLVRGSVAVDFTVVAQTVVDSYRSILMEILRNIDKVDIDMELGSILKHFRAVITLTLNVRARVGLNTSFITERVHQHFLNTAGALRAIAQQESPPADAIVEISEAYQDMIRGIADQMKDSDHELVSPIAEFLTNLSAILISLREKTPPDDTPQLNSIDSQLRRLVHSHPWFVGNAEKINNEMSHSTLHNSVTEIGIRAASAGLNDLETEATKSLQILVQESMAAEFDRNFGFIEPRLIQYLCMLGVINLKGGVYADETVSLVKQLDKAYREKWFGNLPEGQKPTSPNEGQVMLEVIHLYEKCNDFPPIRRLYNPYASAENLFLETVEPLDIERFIYAVWGAVLPDGELHTELEAVAKAQAEAETANEGKKKQERSVRVKK